MLYPLVYQTCDKKTTCIWNIVTTIINSTSNIQCLIKHTMLLESRSKPGNQIIKADKKRINMLKENTVPLIYIFDMSRDIWFQIQSKTIWFYLIDLTKL